MSKKQSEFMAWFVAQHGPRVTGKGTKPPDEQLREYIRRGQAADRELASRELWDEKMQSALYAWQAKGKP